MTLTDEIIDLEAQRDALREESAKLSAKIKNQENTLRQVSDAVKDLWTRLKKMEKHGLL